MIGCEKCEYGEAVLLDDEGRCVDRECESSRSQGCYVSVLRKPDKLGVATLCRLMDDCLPEQIDNEKDMQQLIDKLWPALVCEFERETQPGA